MIVSDPSGLPSFVLRDYNYSWENLIKDLSQVSSQVVVILIEGLHFIHGAHLLPANKRYVFFSTMYWDRAYYPMPFDYYVVQCTAHWWYKTFRYFLPTDAFWHVPAKDLTYDFDSIKPFTFVAHIGQRRLERNIIVEKIQQQCQVKKFIGVYEGQDFGSTNYTKPNWENHFIDTESGQFQQYKTPDGVDPTTGYILSEIIPISTYNLANFNLVVESAITFEHASFFTEKTIKCLFTGMPFLVFGLPNHLRSLRETYGFKTYNELWDESYDSIIDPYQRAEAIVNLINQLESFDWVSARTKLQEIMYYNFRNLLHLREVYTKQTVEQLPGLYNFINQIK